MKNRSFTILILLLSAFTLQACFMSLQGSGKIINEERNISPEFKGVRVSNHGNLIVTIGEAVSLTVEGDDNIIPYISTRVIGEILELSTKKTLRQGWSSRHGIRYHLTVKPGQLNRLALTSHGDAQVPELTGPEASVRLSSHGDVTIDRIQTDDFKLNVSSHGDVKIGELTADSLKVRMTSHGDVRIRAGEVRDQDVSLSSHGDYRAEGMASGSCRVSNTSHGTVKVWVKKTLTARITSHGRLYYRGDPEIDASRASRKKLRRLN